MWSSFGSQKHQQLVLLHGTSVTNMAPSQHARCQKHISFHIIGKVTGNASCATGQCATEEVTLHVTDTLHTRVSRILSTLHEYIARVYCMSMLHEYIA